MRDTTHEDFIIRWISFMKNNPTKWQEIHAAFINAQIENNREFLKRLSKQPNGREKIIKMYNIKNVNGYTAILKQNL